MNEKLFDVCKYLIPQNFKKASEYELMKSLQKLSDFFSFVEHRKRVPIEVDFSRKDGVAGECFIDSIAVYPQNCLTNYQTYLECFDTIVHESFHIFQYHIMHMPKSFIKSEKLWKRISAYNLQYFANSAGKYGYYRLNYFELDAYRFTDFFMLNVYHKFKNEGIKLIDFKKYIDTERKDFYKTKIYCKDFFKGKDIADAIEKANRFFIDDGVYGVALNNEIDVTEFNQFEDLKNEIFDSGKYLYSIFNEPICDLSQDFIDNAERIYKKMMPHIFGYQSEKEQ